MTVITVIIESALSGSPGGFLTISIDDSKLVQEIIDLYCSKKGASIHPSYGLMAKNGLVLVNSSSISDFEVGEGEILRLVELRRSSTLAFREWLIMAGFAMFLGIGGLIVISLLFSVFTTVPDNYAVQISAEPFFTKMVLYQWPPERFNGTGDNLIEYSTVFDAGSVGKPYVENVTPDLDIYLDQMLEVIPKDFRKDREVLFAGLEGLRFLNETDPQAVKKIVEDIRGYLRQSEWNYKDQTIKILSGEEEGLSSWITLNYWASTLKEKVSYLISTEGLFNESFGVMDLGVYSTQIALEVNESFKDSKDVFPVTLFGNAFYVFSKSYLCHGKEEALRRYRALLWIEQGKPEVFTSPCEPPSSLRGTVLHSTYFSSPCTAFADEVDKNLTVIGTGELQECGRVVSKLLNFNECIDNKMGYCINPEELPNDIIQRNYYASSGFNEIMTKAGLPVWLPRSQLEFYLRRMCDFSGESESSGDFINGELCFQLQYVLTLIKEVYGFEEDQEWMHIAFSDKFGGRDQMNKLEWSLGYMIKATNEIAESSAIPTRIKLFPFTCLVILFTIFIGLSVGFTLHGFRIRKNSTEYRRSNLLMMDKELERFILPEKPIKSIKLQVV